MAEKERVTTKWLNNIAYESEVTGHATLPDAEPETVENNNFSTLYSESDKQILKLAEDSLNPAIDRVNEIIEYAKEAKIKKIGIANCTTFLKEANQLEGILIDAGFNVEKVHCKYGKVQFSELVPGYKGISCNPAGQAKYLEDRGTELNIMMGLCLGHDMIFNARSKAPVTPLLVKDRKLKHHTLEVFQSNIKSTVCTNQ